MEVRIALLDLYNGQANEGMRCLRAIVNEWAEKNNFQLVLNEYDVRRKIQLPGLSYQIYISSGGPGSPLTTNEAWEKAYFNWLHTVETYNLNRDILPAKHVFLICHSFQLACRHYELATVCKRHSEAFGVFPVHPTEAGKNDKLLEELADPFYAMDSRLYQVISPDAEKMKNMGAAVLAIEKERPHVPYERALMAIRFSPYCVGTQFHPEADAEGMSRYLLRSDKKKKIIETYGQEKWQSMVTQLDDPDKIRWTYDHLLSVFLDQAIANHL
ncbi:type 1 glutamine amidotransferase [Filimonas effusa]|uniref:GMP synthase n=1 Tax=Filimonas effusa TaxID=2508721 RepID=A0A4V1MAM1_9BACT|nr:GMP synthase [Filimonas effusa]RXK86356.1 GMP synthase [Filimonas effusa]